MLPLVKTQAKKIEEYKELISSHLFNEIKKTSKDLKGLKVFHINATPRGGGVAEILKSLVPLMKGIGLKAGWYTIPPKDDFFEITKKIHNALQGSKIFLSGSEKKDYLLETKRTAELAKKMKPDIWVVHDPQPVGLAAFLDNFHPSVCRLHIDLTSPNKEAWNFMADFLKLYDKVILSSESFIKEKIEKKAIVFQPAIDPLSLKNKPLPLNRANRVLRNFGINPKKPLIAQVSRFDPWKDPLGVVKAYRLAKKKIPDLQLILAGLFLAKDDPEAKIIYSQVKKEIKNDKDIFLFAHVQKLGKLKVDLFFNAIQSASGIILQKSTREGFGLTVTEAMWKEKPVIGGNVGGIRLQIKDAQNGFLVSSPQEAAFRVVQLIENPKLGKKIGKEAKKSVREKFLMPRLLRDYLKLFKELV